MRISTHCHKKQFDHETGDREFLSTGESCRSSQAELMFSVCPPQIMMNVPQPTCASTGCVSMRTAASNVSASPVLCWLPTGGTVSVRRSPSLVSALFPACCPCSWGLAMCLRPRGAEKNQGCCQASPALPPEITPSQQNGHKGKCSCTSTASAQIGA